ncbi:Anaphase-promoting complex subunit 5 [Lecanosticta acicola]|uniref:Anaphase-promoting complex subunit 5 n=1 Tax=Lecanosticta acicola TaxID=111012 RepID=A0AAI8YPL4_9PEZI|nr:Anaphase-promoting complex subunit 5 [Lecanosticta acicola]
MPRFLTPARICLLVAIDIYGEEPPPTASAITLLDFISQHVISSAEQNVDDIQERRAFASGGMEFFEQCLRPLASSMPGRNLYDSLIYRIWQFNSVDSLHAFIEEVSLVRVRPSRDALIQPHPNAFTPASPLGQYVRRCWVEFTRLQFEDAQALWKMFTTYREPTKHDWTLKYPEDALKTEQDVNPVCTVPALPTRAGSEGVAQDGASAAVVDADILLHFAIQRLQKEGSRVPADVKLRIEQWIGDQLDSNTQSLHFFMAFFEHWRAGQYTMALENLHRYFDYSLAGKAATENMRVHYQYALLHLSVLHADFECWGESIDAMNECIATARENQDAACLNFALSWLLHLRHAHPSKRGNSFGTIAGVVGSGGSEHDEIAFLKQKAKDGKHWMLLSSTLLEEARLELYSGGNRNRAQEHILQSMYLNAHHDLRGLAPASLLLQSACYHRLGQTKSAVLDIELLNTVYLKQCPKGEYVRATCRLADLMARSGNFSRALKHIEGQIPAAKGLLKQEQRLKAFATLLQLKRSIQRNQFNVADAHLNQLRPFCSGSDPEMSFEVKVLEIEKLVRQERFLPALQKVRSPPKHSLGLRLIPQDIAHRIYFLLLKARIFAAGGQASKGFAIVLRATATAERQLLVTLFMEGVAVLSKVLIELSEFGAARDIVEAALPHAIESQNTELTARFYTLMGEACLGYAGHECPHDSNEQTLTLRRAQDLFENGRSLFQQTEDLTGMLHCLALKSQIATWTGDESSALQADEMYSQLLMVQSQAIP